MSRSAWFGFGRDIFTPLPPLHPSWWDRRKHQEAAKGYILLGLQRSLLGKCNTGGGSSWSNEEGLVRLLVSWFVPAKRHAVSLGNNGAAWSRSNSARRGRRASVPGGLSQSVDQLIDVLILCLFTAR